MHKSWRARIVESDLWQAWKAYLGARRPGGRTIADRADHGHLFAARGVGCRPVPSTGRRFHAKSGLCGRDLRGAHGVLGGHDASPPMSTQSALSWFCATSCKYFDRLSCNLRAVTIVPE